MKSLSDIYGYTWGLDNFAPSLDERSCREAFTGDAREDKDGTAEAYAVFVVVRRQHACLDGSTMLRTCCARVVHWHVA